jgi:hypothetical protein
VIVAAGFLSLSYPARPQDFGAFELTTPPSVTVRLRPGVSQEVNLKRSYSKAEVENPSIVDIRPETDRAASLHPGGPGSTTVRFRDDKGGLIADFLVEVLPSAPNEQVSTFEDLPGRVKVYRTSDRTGIYRCSPKACELVSEQQLSEAAPKLARPKSNPAPANEATGAPDKDAAAPDKNTPQKQ